MMISVQEKAVKHQKHIMLYWESKLIHKLRGKSINGIITNVSIACVPNLHFVGDEKTEDNKTYHVMVMDLLGKSLEDLFQECRRKFDLKTVLCIAIQMVYTFNSKSFEQIQRIQKVHEERIIHRDIKPDNFLIGGNDQNKNNIFIIDFGLAKCYKNSDGEHIPFREGKNLTGTARYASINTHIGYEQSRRDDLETIGHVLLYFLRGSLPWQGLPGRSKNEKYNNIKKKKLEVTVDELCKGHPEEFREFMNYCRKLQFTEDPDYKYVLGLFEGCMKKNGWDPKVPDFIWNKNRLVLEKEALKQNLMKVISKPIKKQENEEAGEQQTKGGPKIDKNSNTVSFRKI